MQEASKPKHLFRFGTFELDGRLGDLRKDGKARPRLQGQPLEVLLHLLEHPEELVTREALRQRLWPADTFVDYDHSLNAAINKLREALNDSAENPRFIQTIPRRGYRFISPVQMDPISRPSEAPMIRPGNTARVDALSAHQAADPPSHAGHRVQVAERATVLSDARELPKLPSTTVRLLFSCIQVMYLCFYLASLVDVHQLQAAIIGLVDRPTLASTLFIMLTVTALVGIPIRLYLLSAALARYAGLARRFLTLFPALLLLDELWALSPLLLSDRIGAGLSLAATAALLYVPFSQRSLLLMSETRSRAA